MTSIRAAPTIAPRGPPTPPRRLAPPMTEAAIDPGVSRDLYVSLGESLDNAAGSWIVRVYYKPFVDWIWGGCLMMALGGALALSDRRYRATRRQEQALAAGVVP